MALVPGGPGPDSLTGTAGSDVIEGFGGDDTLNGGAGADTLEGGPGNDVYIVDNVGDVVSENPGEGTDLVQASVTYTLAANVENIVLTGGANINATGNTLDNVLTGNGGDNILIGVAGGPLGDTMIGGLGNDTYIVDDTNDSILENPGEGTDLVIASVTYSLSSDVENLTINSSGLTAQGNTLDNVITDTTVAGGNTLAGMGGTDTYVVSNANDEIDGNQGTMAGTPGTDIIESSVSFSLAAVGVNFVANLTLTGTNALQGTGDANNNILTDNGGHDTTTGNGDTLIGGGGTDTYVVSYAADDIVGNGGGDVVQSSVSFSLAAATVNNVNNLTLTGTGGLTATGNGNSNQIIGNTGDDVISDGGGGTDTLVGQSLAGADTFIVNNTNDLLSESVGGGASFVSSSVTFVLPGNVENLTLTGASAVSGTGNTDNNVITSNGAAGGDTLAGGGGVDTYVVNSSNDVVNANVGGSDTVEASVDYNMATNAIDALNLTLIGGIAITGTGNAFDNVITDNGAADTLIGGLGSDTYVVTNAGDVVSENGGEGTDLVITNVNNYTLGANIENLTLTGAGSLQATGNALNNVITDTTTSGANTLIGGGGVDTYVVNNSNDIVTANIGGTDLVESSVSYNMATNAAAAANLTLTGTNAIVGTGNSLNNVITDNGAADTLIGGTGNDTYLVTNTGDYISENVAEGTDLVISSATYTLGANIENLTLTGVGNVTGTGNAANNVITANNGNDVLDGSFGADTMAGGTGNDTYMVDNVGDVVQGNPGGHGFIISSVTYTLPSNVDTLTLTGAAAINATGNNDGDSLTGNAANNVLTGGTGNDVLSGGGGVDTMIGGAGNDTYVVGSTADVISENAAGGTDLVMASVTYSIASQPNIENITLTGSANINATGNTGNNLITGNTGNNILDGGTGVDTMIGGGGTDTFIVDNSSDIVNQAASTASTVLSSVSYTAPANILNLTLTGAANLTATGNALGDVLTANSGKDTLIGNGPTDTFIINSSDTVIENQAGGNDTAIVTLVGGATTYATPTNIENLIILGSGNVHLTGDSGNNVLTGNAGNNVLNGEAGVDTMIGGLGNDTYIVQNSADQCIETSSQGTDLILTTGSYDMSVNAANVENLTLTSKTGATLVGNNWDNIITGNSGNDILVAGGGTDTLIGGAGNDTYFLSNLVSPGHPGADIIKDTSGNDTVVFAGTLPPGSTITAMSYTLQTGIENLVSSIDSTVACTLTGNSANNIIQDNDGKGILSGMAGNDSLIGGAGDETLNGGTGADTMAGGGGADTYFVDNAKDLIIDTATHSSTTATDVAMVSASYVMSPTANVLDVDLTGTRAISFTASNTGETITGNGAHDVITGGLGADTFMFQNVTVGTTTTLPGYITVKNFNVAQGDVLDISHIITGYAADEVVSPFVHVVDSGLNSIVSVNATGDGVASHFKEVAILYGVHGLTGEQALVDSGNLLLIEPTG